MQFSAENQAQDTKICWKLMLHFECLHIFHASLTYLATLFIPPTIQTLLCSPFSLLRIHSLVNTSWRQTMLSFLRKVSSHGRCQWPYNRSLFPIWNLCTGQVAIDRLFRHFLHDKDAYFRWSDPSFSPIALRTLFRDWPIGFSLLKPLFILFFLTRSPKTIRKTFYGHVTLSQYTP